MRKYFTSILLLLTSVCGFAQEVEEEEEQRPAIVDSMYQLRLGLDLSRIYFNQVQKKFEQRTSYELELDFYWRRDLYFVLDGGFGNSSLSYGDLTYNSNNVFFRGGFNKSLLPRLKQHDWDMAFIGLRYGVGMINRSAATYSITDSSWGIFTGSAPAENMTAHWIELTGGVRVEVVKCLYLGWNVRGKFMLNAKRFSELPPYNIAGYGKGEKPSIFDFNVYLSYAMRWNRKHIQQPKK